MNLIKYFTYQYRFLIYATLALLFALLTANLVHRFNLAAIAQLFSVFLVLAYIMRINNDIYHYKSNRHSHKKRFISKNGLFLLLAILSIVYLALNIIFYKHLGVFAILLLGIVYIWELFPFGKIIFLPLANLFYFYFYGGKEIFQHYEVWLSIIILLLISIGVYCYKRGKK